MSIVSRFLSESLVPRLGFALGSIVVLALVATVSATVFAEVSAGKAAALNLAGSLRMQSYWIAVQVLRSGEAAQSPEALHASIAEFDARLDRLRGLGGVPAASENPTRRAFEHVAAEWSRILRPAIARAIAGGAAARDPFVARVSAFVGDVDRVAHLLERDLERRIQTLRIIQGAVLFAILVVLFASAYLMRSQALIPLAELLHCARRMRVGDFTVRARHTGDDELGQLGQAFNQMAEALSRSYATLEARVEEKTEKLARSNLSLELLYNVTRTLSESPLSESTLRTLMDDIERVIGLAPVAICVREEGDQCGYPIASGKAAAPGRPAAAACTKERCYGCFDQSEPGVRQICTGDERLLSVPLAEGSELRGVLLLQASGDAEVAEWKLRLLGSIGHHVGAALAAAKRTEERRRMALLEERSIIARELHDSLAQSLSYLKIQVTRLSALLKTDARNGPAVAVLDELKLGVSNAYRQLRELLTTFRLRIDDRGLSDALRETIREFAERTRIRIELHDHLLGHELDSSEQIHVLQVVREALTNVEHHAHAGCAAVRLAGAHDRVRVTVEDDGVGIRDAEPAAAPHHYGIAIMRDRAATLGGSLSISRRAEGGTRVELEFAPRGLYHAGAASAGAPA
jgi:two-component system nitrate/nitrite sensor histidine kinase NarX